MFSHSVKIAGYWPWFFFACFMDPTSVSVHKPPLKKTRSPDIHPSWPHSWSVSHVWHSVSLSTTKSCQWLNWAQFGCSRLFQITLYVGYFAHNTCSTKHSLTSYQECCSNPQSSSAWDSLCWCILEKKYVKLLRKTKTCQISQMYTTIHRNISVKKGSSMSPKV